MYKGLIEEKFMKLVD